MIIVIQGSPGSGKSYEATVYHALRALKRGRKVITNLPLKVDKFSELDPEFADLIELRTDPDTNSQIFSEVEHYSTNWKGTDPDSKKEMGPLFVIDECHRSIGPGMPTEELKDWYAMHRHKGYDIVLITQDSSDIDRSITNRVDHSISVENLKRKGLSKSYMRRVFSNSGWRTHLEAETIRHFKKEYFALYNSYTQGGSGLELGSSDGQSLLKQPYLWFCGFILVIALGGAIYGTTSILGRDGKTFLFPDDAAKDQKKAEKKPASTTKREQKRESAKQLEDSNKKNQIILSGLEELNVIKYAGVLSNENGNIFLFQNSNSETVSYSAGDLKKAGYTVLEVHTCGITIRDIIETRIISC